MSAMTQAWWSVLRADARRIVRDPFLLLMTTYLPFVALLLSWAIPALSASVKQQVDLPTYYPAIMVVFALILPYVMGAVLGMQMLGEKDEGSLSAVAVTPFSFRQYFLVRAVLFSTLGALLTVLSHKILGLVQLEFVPLCLVALALSLNTPLCGLFFATVAKSQVQGFAVLKGSGFLMLGPALSFFIPPHWDLLVGLIPLYWPVKAYFLAVSGGLSGLFWVAFALSFLYQGAMIYVLYGQFTRRALR